MGDAWFIYGLRLSQGMYREEWKKWSAKQQPRQIRNQSGLQIQTGLPWAKIGAYVIVINNSSNTPGLCMQVVQSLLQYNCDVERQWQGPGGQSCSLLGVALQHAHLNMLSLLADAGAVCTVDDLAEMSVDLASAVVSDPATADWLRELVSEPRSLQRLCRRRIRRQLSCDIHHEVDRLPLPSKLRQYIVQV